MSVLRDMHDDESNYRDMPFAISCVTDISNAYSMNSLFAHLLVQIVVHMVAPHAGTALQDAAPRTIAIMPTPSRII